MGRQLTGRIVQKPSGRFQASMPASRGSTVRKYEMFDSRAQAQAWCALAIAALEAGEPLPSAEVVLGRARGESTTATTAVERPRRSAAKYVTAPSTPDQPMRLTVADVAADWFTEIYVDGRSSGIERAIRVQSVLQRYVVAFLAPIIDNGDALTRAEYREYLASLGRPGVRQGKAGRRVARDGLVQDTLNDVRRCLDGVLRHGTQHGAWELFFDPATVRTPRSAKKSAPKATALTLGDVARIAANLHAAHQVTLWTCRILTLRLGEAYGIRVSDLIRLDDGTGRGLLWLHAQGGRRFAISDGDDVVYADHKEGMKHEFSERMQLVPAPLMALFDDVIDVFHTDPKTGHVDADARLIPGLSEGDRGGQQGFRYAFAKAATAAGIARTAVNGFTRVAIGTPTPKDLRSSAVTDLEWTPGLDAAALRRYAGHAPGTDVHALHYVIDQPGNAKATAVCVALEDMIASEVPDGLRVPTVLSCTTGMQPSLQTRAAVIDDHLSALGWLITDSGDGDPWLTIDETAQVLGLAPVTIRRWVREGRIVGETGRGRNGAHEVYRIRESTVVELARVEDDLVTLSDMEERTGIGAKRLRNWIERFSLDHTYRGQYGLILPPATVTELQRLTELERQCQRFGLTYAEAAQQLGVTSRTIAMRVQLGTLQGLPEAGPDGRPYVTRTSVIRAIERPALMRKRPGRRRQEPVRQISA